MKRLILIIGSGILLLVISSGVMAGKRTATDGGSAERFAPKRQPVTTPPAANIPSPPVASETVAPALPFAAEPTSAPATAYENRWRSLNGGGGASGASGSKSHSSAGQSAIGYASSANYSVGIGYWYGAGCVCDCHADPECDGSPNVFDVVHAVSVGFRNDPDIEDANRRCRRNTTDVDCDGDTDVFDVVKFVNVAFRNEPPENNFCVPCGA